MKLNELKPDQGAKKKRTRVGRGISAGKGKTAGRGMKGQKSRSGSGGNIYRQGGNLPFYRRLPFMRGVGFTPPNQIEYNEINIEQLVQLKGATEITPEYLAEKGLLHKKSNPVAILGRGEINAPIVVRAHRFTKSAQAKIEAAGGKIEIIT